MHQLLVLSQQQLPDGSGGAGAAGAAGLGLMCLFSLLGVAALAFWIWMLIDAATKLPSGTEKIVWILVIVFTGVIGALIYFFVRPGKAAA